MTVKVEMYTDGACRGNPGEGGWGVWMDWRGNQKSLNGFEAETTNNRMELTAAIRGLETLKRGCAVNLYTDSKYVMQGINEWMPRWKLNGWKTTAKKSVKNADLWVRLDEALQRHEVTWHWVKGHAGNAGNEKADQLANEAIDAQLAD